MAVTKNRPKGIYKIQYPLPDVRMRFVNETNEGEIIFDKNRWIFDPPIDIGAIQIAGLERWDPEVDYEAGDTYVSYIYDGTLLPEDDPFYTELIYRCIENTVAGQSPFTHPEKWLRLARVDNTTDTVSNIHISNVYGLEEILNNTININNLGDQFTIDDNGKLVLNIKYITVNDYSPAQNIIPEPVDPEEPASGEVRLNNTIWKIHNEVWTDGDSGILVPRLNPTTLADVQVYGYLYNQAAIQRLLAANPGYRLPTIADFNDSFSNFILPGKPGPSVYPIFKVDTWQNSEGWVSEPGVGSGWNTVKSNITNSTGLSLVSAGAISTGTALSTIFVGTYQGIRMWGEGGTVILATGTMSGGIIDWAGIRYLTTNPIVYAPGTPLPLDRYYNVYYPVRLVKDI